MLQELIKTGGRAEAEAEAEDEEEEREREGKGPKLCAFSFSRFLSPKSSFPASSSPLLDLWMAI